MKRSPIRAGAKSIARGSTFAAEGRPLKRSAATPRSDFRDDAGRIIPTAPIPVSRGRSKGNVPRAARFAAYARSEGACVVCVHGCRGNATGSALRGLIACGVVRRAVQVHHVLPKSKWPHLLKVADNLVGVCADCHARHESAYLRIPHAALPAVTLALAEREGLTWYIARTYPEASAAC